jgi:hypothetical protein
MGLLLFLLIGGSAVFFSSRGNSGRAAWDILTSSPDGNYRVKLSGKADKPIRSYYPHGTHKVTYALFKYGNVFLSEVPLYGGGQYDDLFLDLYPTQEWVSNSTLRFGEKRNPSEGFDKILITNNGQYTIECLRINFGISDIFLTFELAPTISIALDAKAQTDKQSDISGIHCFADIAGRLPEKDAAFSIRGRYKGPATYNISVEDSTIIITSDQFQPTNETSRR